MTKREFDKLLTESLKGMSLEKQEIQLRKLQDWISQKQDKLQAKINKSYIKCSKCERYSLRNKLTIIDQYEKRQSKYSIDDDFLPDITYHIYYYICPNCGTKIEMARHREIKPK